MLDVVCFGELCMFVVLIEFPPPPLPTPTTTTTTTTTTTSSTHSIWFAHRLEGILIKHAALSYRAR